MQILMWKPDARLHNQDPEYFADLVKSSGRSHKNIADEIGCDERTIRRWISGDRKYSYPVQYIVECLVLGASA